MPFLESWNSLTYYTLICIISCKYKWVRKKKFGLSLYFMKESYNAWLQLQSNPLTIPLLGPWDSCLLTLYVRAEQIGGLRIVEKHCTCLNNEGEGRIKLPIQGPGRDKSSVVQDPEIVASITYKCSNIFNVTFVALLPERPQEVKLQTAMPPSKK